MLTIWKGVKGEMWKDILTKLYRTCGAPYFFFCDGGPGAKSYQRSLSVLHQHFSRGRCYVKSYLKGSQLFVSFCVNYVDHLKRRKRWDVKGCFNQVISHVWRTLLFFCDGGPGAKSYRRSLSVVHQHFSRGRCYVKLYLKVPNFLFHSA